MSVHLEAVLKVGATVRLVSLPSKRNRLYNELKPLLNTAFIFKGFTSNRAKGLFLHAETGVTYTLITLLFLDHERFYYDLNSRGIDKKTALITIAGCKAKSFNDSSKKYDLAAFTIFSEYEKVGEKHFLVTSNNGTKLILSKWAVSPIFDVEYVHVEPQLDLEELEVEKPSVALVQDYIEVSLESLVSEPFYAVLPKTIQAYEVHGKDFYSQADAQQAANLLDLVKTKADSIFSEDSVPSQVAVTLAASGLSAMYKIKKAIIGV